MLINELLDKKVNNWELYLEKFLGLIKKEYKKYGKEVEIALKYYRFKKSFIKRWC